MLRAEIKEKLTEVIAAKFGEKSKINFSVEVPEDLEHGDYSTNVALILGKMLGESPMNVAEQITKDLQTTSYKLRNQDLLIFFFNQKSCMRN